MRQWRPRAPISRVKFEHPPSNSQRRRPVIPSWNFPLYSRDTPQIPLIGRTATDYASSERLRCRPKNALLPAIVTVRRHWLSVTTSKRAIVIPDIADAPIDIREGCPLFPSVGNTADSRPGAVFHPYVGAATPIRSVWCRLGIGGSHEHRAGDQERCKRSEKDFHGRSEAASASHASCVPRYTAHRPGQDQRPTTTTRLSAIKYNQLLPPPAISVVAAASAQHQNHDDNQNGCHSFLQNMRRVASLLHVGWE
jgi:hypothetical protein